MLQRSNTVKGTVISSRPATAARRMKKLTATGVTEARIALLTTTTSAHSAVMPKAAAIQMAYVLVTTPPRLAPQSTARQV